MRRRYLLAPEAAGDLVQIWRYIKDHATLETADRVESPIRMRIVYLARSGCNLHGSRDIGQQLRDRF